MTGASRWLLAMLLLPAVMAAQQAPPRQGGRGAEQRSELEARVRQQFARVVQQRVGLTDEQMARLGPINERHSQQRRELQLQERNARVALQRVLRGRDTADSAEVARQLQMLVDVHQRRAALLAAEQRDLAAIMTPIQRARYMALQEQVRRQLEQRRDRRGGPPARQRPQVRP